LEKGRNKRRHAGEQLEGAAGEKNPLGGKAWGLEGCREQA